MSDGGAPPYHPGYSAIETPYKGYLMGSRTEAKWAMFFDQFAQPWEKMTQPVPLQEGAAYLPDLYLPSTEVYIEIKPAQPTPPMLVQVGSLAVTTSRLAYLISGSPWANKYNILRFQSLWPQAFGLGRYVDQAFEDLTAGEQVLQSMTQSYPQYYWRGIGRRWVRQHGGDARAWAAVLADTPTEPYQQTACRFVVCDLCLWLDFAPLRPPARDAGPVCPTCGQPLTVNLGLLMEAYQTVAAYRWTDTGTPMQAAPDQDDLFRGLEDMPHE